MSEQQHVELVRKGYEAFRIGDMPGLLETLDEHVLWVTPGPDDLPMAGTRRGHQGVREFFQTLNSMIDILRFEPKQVVAQGDRVIVLGSDAFKVKRTGRTLQGEWAHAFTIRNGKIVAFQEYRDTSAIVAELAAKYAHA